MEYKEKKSEAKQFSSFADKSAAIEALYEPAKAGGFQAEYKLGRLLEESLFGVKLNSDFLAFRSQVHVLLALDSRDSQIFLHLLSQGVNVNFKKKEHYLPEWIALNCQWPLAEKEEALQALARRGVHLNPFLLAAFKGEKQALSPAALSVTDSCGNNIAHYAAANGQLTLLKQLISGYPDLVTRSGGGLRAVTPLMRAASNGKLEVVQWLLREGGAKVTEKDGYGRTALLYAAKAGHLEVVQWLLREGGAKVSEGGWWDNGIGTALVQAAGEGHLPLVQWLLREGGAKITETGHDGRTALLYAAATGHLEVVQWLLREGGAKITETGHDGETALLLAAGAGSLQLVQWLLREGGAKITEKTDRGGGTALHLAARAGNLQLVQWLLRQGGAKITEKHKVSYEAFARTALHFAAEAGHLEVVQWLLREGGERVIKQEGYWEVLPQAAIEKHANIVNCLIADFGADPGDGSGIARLLDVRYETRGQEAKELQALFHNYHAKQQLTLHKRVLDVSLPNFPKELRGIIAEYFGIDDKEKRGLLPQTLVRNEGLLKELKAYVASWNPFPLTSKRLARGLMAEVSSQHPCNELTIHEAVFALLGAHRQEITDIDLLNILEKILRETHYFELSNQQSSDKPKLAESKQSDSPNSSGVNKPSQQLPLSPREIADILNYNYKELGVLDKPSWIAGERSAYTSVNSKEQAELLVCLLQEHFSEHFNFIIEDVLSAASSTTVAVTSYNLHVNAKIKVSQQSTAEQTSPSSVPLKESKRESKEYLSTTSAQGISIPESLLNDLCCEARAGNVDALFTLTGQLYKNKQPNHFYINPLLAALASKDAITFKFLLALAPEQVLQGYSSKLEGEIISTSHWQEKERQSALQAWEGRVLFWAPEKQDNKSGHPPSLSASSLTKQAPTARDPIRFLPPPSGKVNKVTDDQEKEKLLKEVEPSVGDSQQGSLRFLSNGDGN
jgi:ankyrin repeat protein